jgi:hypothetical protein
MTGNTQPQGIQVNLPATVDIAHIADVADFIPVPMFHRTRHIRCIRNHGASHR